MLIDQVEQWVAHCGCLGQPSLVVMTIARVESLFVELSKIRILWI